MRKEGGLWPKTLLGMGVGSCFANLSTADDFYFKYAPGNVAPIGVETPAPETEDILTGRALRRQKAGARESVGIWEEAAWG